MTAVKETRAEKNRRLIAEREAELLAIRKEQLLVNPARILKLIALAQKYANDGVTVVVYDGHLDPTNIFDPQLRVVFNLPRNGYIDDQSVHVFGEDWEFAAVEGYFHEIDMQKAAELKRIETAREAFDLLSEEQRQALGLMRRP